MNHPVRQSALVAATFVLLLALEAGAAPKTRIALLPLEGRDGVNPVLSEVMTEALAAELMSRPNLSVITPKDIEAALGFEKQKAKVNAAVAAGTGNEVCTDNSCLQEIGGALGVDLTVSGTISRLGSSWILTVQAFNPRKAEVVKRHFARVASKEPDALLDSVPDVAYELFPEGATPPRPKGGLVAQQPPPQQPAPQQAFAVQTQPPAPPPSAFVLPQPVPGPGEGLSLLKFTYAGEEPSGVRVRVSTAEGTKECTSVTTVNPCKLTVPAGRAQVSVTGAVELDESVELPSNTARQALVFHPPSRVPMLVGGALSAAVGGIAGYYFLTSDVCTDSDSGGLCALTIVGAVGGLSVGVPLTIIGFFSVLIGPSPSMQVFELREVPGTASLPKKLLEGTTVAVHPNGGGVSTRVEF